MANRRSLNEAIKLSDVQQQFISGGAVPAPEAVTPSLVPEPKEATPLAKSKEPAEEGSDEEPEKQEAPVINRRSRSKTPSTTEDPLMKGFAKLWVPLTTKLKPKTAAALKRTALEQELRGAQPATVQEIVEIAVSSWLEQQGFL